MVNYWMSVFIIPKRVIRQLRASVVPIFGMRELIRFMLLLLWSVGSPFVCLRLRVDLV